MYYTKNSFYLFNNNNCLMTYTEHRVYRKRFIEIYIWMLRKGSARDDLSIDAY